jgi:hypothetical protein
MTPRKILAIVTAAVPAVILLAACGGDDNGGPNGPSGNGDGAGSLTDPSSVPTATPWDPRPDVIFVEPGQITPISGGATPAPNGNGGDGNGNGIEPGVCGAVYIVVAGDFPGAIAEKCGVTVEDLLEANPGLEPTNIHIGDELIIPQ